MGVRWKSVNWGHDLQVSTVERDMTTEEGGAGARRSWYEVDEIDIQKSDYIH